MITFQFIAAPMGSHAHAEIELLYLIRGDLHMRVGAQEYDLHSDDYLIVNSGSVHEFTGSGDLLLGEFHIQPDKLSDALGRTDLRFRCNSTATDTPEKYEPAREVMREIFSRFHNNRARDVLRMYSLYYRLLHLLSSNFLMIDTAPSEPQPPPDSRTSEITEYIRLNYDKPIRLNDLADQLHLSVAYLSKYIKKNLGMSFLDYVASIRLSHAVTALLHTNTSVARIAMDTGFANLSSFNKAFREHYQMTPSAFRQQNRTDLSLETEVFSPALTGSVEAQPSPAVSASREDTNQIYLTVPQPTQEPVPLPHGWCEMVNIGTAADLLRADVQQQTLLMRNRLHCRYIRFWDLYSPEMLLNAPSPEGLYTFSRLDNVLDFLVQNNLKPYIELGDKPRRVFLKTPRAESSPVRQAFSGRQEFYGFLQQLIRHLVTRYGAQELESWFFELWMPELDTANDMQMEDNLRNYLADFEHVAAILRFSVPELRIGGGGFSLRYGEAMLRRLIALWAGCAQHPWFISLYCYPTMDLSEKTAVLENQLVNPNSIKKSLQALREILANSNLSYHQVHVTEWNISIVQRSVLNDSYFKAAYIVKNLLDSQDLAELYGYWVATDLYSEGSDAPQPLFGGCGLISRNSIPKPAWYAMEFLNELGDQLFCQGENYVVTRDGAGCWRVLCHNYKYFNYQYYLSEDTQLEMQQLDDLLSDTSPLNLTFELPAEAGSSYRVKSSRIGKGYGSIQDLWQSTGCVPQPGVEDLADLARASVPQISLTNLTEYGGLLHFQARLEHNEILLIVLSPRD